jgi:drug/metabolite transporter (DMT)-like permease
MDDQVDHRGRESLAAPPRLDSALLMVAVTGVSFSGPVMAATAAPALAIAFWRNALGSIVTLPVALIRRGREVRALRWRTLGVAGGAGVALSAHFATWVPSVTMTSVASATALVATQSIFTALIAQRRGQRLPTAAWAGIVVSTLGVLLVTGADVGLSGRALVGDLLAVLGGLFAAIYVTIGSSARQQISTSVYTAICYAVCAMLLFVVCVIGQVHLHGFSNNAWLKIAAVTVCAQLLGHSLINVVLRSASPTVVSLAILLETPGAALIAAVWLHQRPPYLAIPGLIMLLAGLVLVGRARSREQLIGEVDVVD